MTKIHIQGTKWLAHFLELSYFEQKNKIYLLQYDVLYFCTKLNGLKRISEEKYKIKIEEIQLTITDNTLCDMTKNPSSFINCGYFFKIFLLFTFRFSTITEF